MFKSLFLRVGNISLILLIIFLPDAVASLQDTITHTESVADSTLIFLQGKTFNRMLDQAIEYQKKADLLERRAIGWRKEAAKMDDPTQRGRLQKRIIQVEDSVEIYTQLSNEHFQYLNASIPEKAKPKPEHPFLIKDTVLSGITVYKYNLTDEFLSLLEEIRASEPEDIPEEETQITPDPVVTGTSETEDPDPVDMEKAENSETEVAESPGFHIYDKSPYGPDKPMERDFTIPPGVFYRIQLAVYRNQLPEDHFGGLWPITTEAIPERELTRYFVGKFTHMEDARSALVKVRSRGYPDAFVIGYYDGRRSAFSKLKELEK